MRLEKFTLLVGLNDKDTKKQVISNEHARDIIMDNVGDCTISDAFGSYTHDNGEKVREKTYRVEILFKNKSEVVDICNRLKKQLNQESIAVMRDIIESELI